MSGPTARTFARLPPTPTATSRSPRSVDLRRRLAIVLLGAALAGCAAAPVGPPPPASLALSVTVAPEANPDANGRPSPIVVRVYQLRGDAAFASADWFALQDAEQATLGAELVAREEYVLAPGTSRSVTLELAREARFVGATAGFRDLRNAQWRALQPAPAGDAPVLGLRVDAAAISFAVPRP